MRILRITRQECSIKGWDETSKEGSRRIMEGRPPVNLDAESRIFSLAQPLEGA
jgi:hypothetical protein